MSRLQNLNRKQKRSFRRQLVATMCATVMTSAYGILGAANTEQNGSLQNRRTIASMIGATQVSAEAGETVDGITESEYTTIEVAKYPVGETKRTISIDKDGVYLLIGNNFDAEKEVYVPTEVVVEEGVTATLYLKDFSIINRDANPNASSGTDNGTIALQILGNATLKLLGDVVLKNNSKGSRLYIGDYGTCTIADSAYTISMGWENPPDPFNQSAIDTILVRGSLCIEGSTIELTEVCYPDVAVACEKDGRIDMKGGTWKNIEFHELSKHIQSHMTMTGGRLLMADTRKGAGPYGVEYVITEMYPVQLTGLPADAQITQLQQMNTSTYEALTYGTNGCVTDEDGTIMINFFEALEEGNSGALKIILYCNGEFYMGSLNMSNKYEIAMEKLAPQEASEVHILHARDFDTEEALYDLFLYDKDEDGNYLLFDNGDKKRYTYEYYTEDKVTPFGSVMNGVNEETIYVKRTEKLYTVTFAGGASLPSRQCPYDYNIPKAADYYFVESDGTLWNGHVTENITVAAVERYVKNRESYMKINSAEDMLLYEKVIENSSNDVRPSGFLGMDIDLSSAEFDGISNFGGHFDGNGHSITIAMAETGQDYDALFRTITSQSTIENLTSKGTIITTKRNAGGIVGLIQYGDKSTIRNCASEVEIAYVGEGDSYAGGVLGKVKGTSVDIQSCVVRGGAKNGLEDMPISMYGGFLGEVYNGTIYIGDCVLDLPVLNATNSQNFVAFTDRDVNIKDCYYTSAIGTSTQGEQKEASFINSPAMAWQMNTGNGSFANTECWTIIDGKLNPCAGENKPVYRAMFNSEGVYLNKTGSKDMRYSDPQTGKVSSLPDMSGYIYSGQTYQWLMNGVEFTGDEIITEDCEVKLSVSGGDDTEVTITGALSKQITCAPGTELPDLDQYYYFCPAGASITIVDQSITELVAKSKLIIGTTQYMQIDTLEDMELFRKAINAGSTVNGYLNADLNLGNAVAIGTAEHPFAGVFDGNGHTITLAIAETEQTEKRALFGTVGEGAIIRNVITSGSIETNGKCAGGIVGGITGSVTIENCGSEVAITFSIDDSTECNGNATCGGIVGISQMQSDDVAQITNCYYVGEMIGYTEHGTPLSGQGGICGWCDVGRMNITNCFVDAAFESGAADPGRTFARGRAVYLYDCYYTTSLKPDVDASDVETIKIAAAELASREFAYRLNTRDGEQANAMVWTYADVESHPTFANAERKATCKVTLEHSLDSLYWPMFHPNVLYTNAEGKVDLSTITSDQLRNGDTMSWENTDGPVTSDTIFASDGTLICKITMTKANLISVLQRSIAPSPIYSKDLYTTESYMLYESEKTRIEALLSQVEQNPDSVTEEQLLSAARQVKDVMEALVPKSGTLTVVSSDGANEIVSIQPLGAGNYADGDIVTILTPEIEGYNFVGWFRGEEQTPIATTREYSFTFGNTNLTYTAKYDALPESKIVVKYPEGVVSMTITGLAPVSQETPYQENGNSVCTYGYRNGSRITIEADAEDFLYWVNEYNKVVSTSNAYTFTVTGGTELTAIYAKADKSTVMYQSGYGQILKSYMVNASEIDSVVEPTTAPAKFGYEFEKWSLTKEEIKAKIEAGESLIKVTALYTANVNNHTITVTNGTGGGSFAYGTVVHVIPNTPQDGFKFSHWKDVTTGKVVSYQDEFCFYANRDMNVEAVYVDVNAEVVETGTAEIMQVKVDDTNKKVSFTAMLTVPENCTIELAGIIATDDATIGSDATSFTAEKAKFVRGDAWTGVTYYYTWTKSNVGAETWYARAYLVYKDEDGNTQTVYGDIKPSK